MNMPDRIAELLFHILARESFEILLIIIEPRAIITGPMIAVRAPTMIREKTSRPS